MDGGVHSGTHAAGVGVPGGRGGDNGGGGAGRAAVPMMCGRCIQWDAELVQQHERCVCVQDMHVGICGAGVTSCNTLDCADSSHTVHMTSCTRHHLPVAPSHLGPVPCAWIYLCNLFPYSVHLPVSVSFRILSLYDLSVYVIMICFLLCPLVPCAHMFLP